MGAAIVSETALEDGMSGEKELCIICAWRATCQKQFSLKAGQRCPEFSRDFLVKDKAEEAKKEEQFN